MTTRAEKSECPHCGADTGDLAGKTTFHCEFCGRVFPVREVPDREPQKDQVIDAQLQLNLKKMDLQMAAAQKQREPQEVVVHAPIQVKNPFIESPYREMLFERCQSIRQLWQLGFGGSYEERGYIRRTMAINGDRTTTYRMIRPTDPMMGSSWNKSYTSTFRAGKWSQLFMDTYPPVARLVPPGICVLFVGWFCNVDLGGGMLRAVINGVERCQTPAAFVYPVRQYLTPEETYFLQPNDAISFEVFNDTPNDITGVVMPVAAIIGPAAQLGLEYTG